MALQPGSRLGPYVLGGSLGRGGMGDVFDAHDPRLGRRVAIKTLRPELLSDDRARRRFDREARAISGLSHPNICTVFDVGHQDGVDFLVMEYIDGEPLSSLLEKGPLGESAVLEYGARIADALAEAHQHGILHRDIKPHNVMITTRGQVKVLDFGLATALAGHLTDRDATVTSISRPGDVAGTPAYMSPEQVRGEQLDARSDAFSFGALLYEALTGRAPFPGRSSAETMSAILTAEPAPVRDAAPHTSAELDRLVRKCLEKDKARRYQTLRDAAIDLENIRSETSSRGPSRGPASGRHGRRLGRPLTLNATIRIAAAAALVVVALVAVATFTRRPSPGPTMVARTMAVLPLKPLTSGLAENAYGLGIADALITQLSGSPSLTVRPTSAVRRYAMADVDAIAAARELGADVVLDGSWLRSGERFRITVNLLRAGDGQSLWAQSYEFKTTDLFAIQDEVSRQLVTTLRLQVDPGRASRGGRPGTTKPDAHEAFVRGQFYFSDRGFNPESRENSDRAITLWQRAVQIDPDYAEAQANLGYAYAWTAIFIEDNAALIARAKEAIDRAARLEAGLGHIHLTRGLILWSKYENWNLAAAIPEFRRVADLDPHLANAEIATVYLHLGLVAEWKRLAEAALDQNPLNEQLKKTYVNEHFLSNQPDEGLETQRRLFGSGPDERYYLLAGKADEAERILQGLIPHAAEDPWVQADGALLRALQGRHAEAQRLAARAVAATQKNRSYHHQAYTVARIYGLGGDARMAARWLQETIDWGFPGYPIFAADRAFDRVRDAPEFQQVLTTLRRKWDGYVALMR